MIKRILPTLAACFLLIGIYASSQSFGQDASLQSKLIGKWTNQNEAKGPAIIDITSVDPATGQLKGKYSPPAGAAAGKEFAVVGWVSSAPRVANRDNVIVASFSVSP